MVLFYEIEWHSAKDNMKYNQMLEKETVFDFLHGLNKELYEVIGRLLATKPFPNVREAFSEVRREESRNHVMLGAGKELSPENVSALVTKKYEPSYSAEQRGN